MSPRRDKIVLTPFIHTLTPFNPPYRLASPGRICDNGGCRPGRWWEAILVGLRPPADGVCGQARISKRVGCGRRAWIRRPRPTLHEP